MDYLRWEIDSEGGGRGGLTQVEKYGPDPAGKHRVRVGEGEGVGQSWNRLGNVKPVRSGRLESHVQPVKFR